MAIKIIGVYPSNSVKDCLSLKIPVFANSENDADKEFFFQKIEANSGTIINFIRIENLEFKPFSSDISKKSGEEAIYGFEFNEEIVLGNKQEICQKIIDLIEIHNFTARNLYSLYTFLGLPKMVEKAVDDIISNNELQIDIKLTRNNFALPDATPFHVNSPADVKAILASYLPVLINSTMYDYTDVISTNEEALNYDTVHVGTHKLDYNKFIGSLYEILDELQYDLPSDKVLNDIILNILLIYRQPIPEKTEIIHVSNENIYSPDPLANKDTDSVNDLFVRSSTSYYKYQPEAELADESFVIKGHRVARSQEHETDETVEVEISFSMNIQLDRIAQSILQQNIN